MGAWVHDDTPFAILLWYDIQPRTAEIGNWTSSEMSQNAACCTLLS